MRWSQHWRQVLGGLALIAVGWLFGMLLSPGTSQVSRTPAPQPMVMSGCVQDRGILECEWTIVLDEPLLSSYGDPQRLNTPKFTGVGDDHFFEISGEGETVNLFVNPSNGTVRKERIRLQYRKPVPERVSAPNTRP